MSTYHRMILADINGEGARKNRRHYKARSIYTIVTPKGVPIHEGDSHFSDLENTDKKPRLKAIVAVLWIS